VSDGSGYLVGVLAAEGPAAAGCGAAPRFDVVDLVVQSGAVVRVRLARGAAECAVRSRGVEGEPRLAAHTAADRHPLYRDSGGCACRDHAYRGTGDAGHTPAPEARGSGAGDGLHGLGAALAHVPLPPRRGLRPPGLRLPRFTRMGYPTCSAFTFT